MSDAFANKAAKFLVPFLLGLVASAFFVGKAYGGDRGDLSSISKRLDGVETKAIETDKDRVTLARIEERVIALQADNAKLMKFIADIAASRIVIGTKKEPD